MQLESFHHKDIKVSRLSVTLFRVLFCEADLPFFWREGSWKTLEEYHRIWQVFFSCLEEEEQGMWATGWWSLSFCSPVPFSFVWVNQVFFLHVYTFVSPPPAHDRCNLPWSPQSHSFWAQLSETDLIEDADSVNRRSTGNMMKLGNGHILATARKISEIVNWQVWRRKSVLQFFNLNTGHHLVQQTDTSSK